MSRHPRKSCYRSCYRARPSSRSAISGGETMYNPKMAIPRKRCDDLNDLEDARTKIEAWRIHYNEVRPHSALGNRTPTEYAERTGLAQ